MTLKGHAPFSERTDYQVRRTKISVEVKDLNSTKNKCIKILFQLYNNKVFKKESKR